jgi:hypothetical protein
MPTRRLSDREKPGAVRDEDVAIAALENRSKADENVGEGEAIAEEHRRQRGQARSVLEETIEASAIAELRGFPHRLETATKLPEDPAAEEGANQVLTFSQLGASIIGDRLKQLTDYGDSVYRPPEQTIAPDAYPGQRLRYAVELCAVLGR